MSYAPFMNTVNPGLYAINQSLISIMSMIILLQRSRVCRAQGRIFIVKVLSNFSVSLLFLCEKKNCWGWKILEGLFQISV